MSKDDIIFRDKKNNVVLNYRAAFCSKFETNQKSLNHLIERCCRFKLSHIDNIDNDFYTVYHKTPSALNLKKN